MFLRCAVDPLQSRRRRFLPAVGLPYYLRETFSFEACGFDGEPSRDGTHAAHAADWLSVLAPSASRDVTDGIAPLTGGAWFGRADASFAGTCSRCGEATT